jgi:hypothetical protein
VKIQLYFFLFLQLTDGQICANCEFMLKSFHEFKGSILKSHEKLTIAKGSENTLAVKTRRNLGISTTSPVIKLPSSISVKRVRSQPRSERKLDDEDIKFEEIQKLPVEVIQLSDSDDCDDRLDNDFAARDSTDEDSKKPKVQRIKSSASELTAAKSTALRQLQGLKSKLINLELTEVTSFEIRRKPGKDSPQPTGIKVTCDVCNFQTDKSYLAQHFALRHIGNKAKQRVQCDKCPSRFQSRDKLIFHQNYKHPDRGEFTCPNCYSIFTTIDLLKEHQRNFKCYKRLKRRSATKKPQQQILCPICGKMMDTGRLNCHIAREHVKEKKYVCSVIFSK